MKNFKDIALTYNNEFGKCTHHGYHFFYPTFLEKLREEKFNMLEIGFGEGESIGLWKEYFPYSNVFIMDINVEKILERCKVIKGDQSNSNDLIKVKNEIGTAKFIIDDGSHNSDHQIETFHYFFRELLEPGGIYIIEDIECNYWKYNEYLYGYRVGFSNVLDYTKKLVDKINSEFSNEKNDLKISSITYGQNCIIITKQTEEESKYFDSEYRFKHLLK